MECAGQPPCAASFDDDQVHLCRRNTSERWLNEGNKWCPLGKDVRLKFIDRDEKKKNKKNFNWFSAIRCYVKTALHRCTYGEFINMSEYNNILINKI